MKRKLILRQALVCISACLICLCCKAQQNFDTLVDYNNYDEFPYSVYQIQDSGYVFITSGDDYNTNTYYIEFNKLYKDGSVAFQKIFGFFGNQLYVGFSNSLKPTFDGGWVLGGGLGNFPLNDGSGLLVKYNAMGDTEFVKVVSDTVWETFYDCIQTSDSGYVLVGDKDIFNHGSDFWIVKTDATGNVVWERTLGTVKDEQAFHVIENAQHQLVVSGAKETVSPTHYPYVAIYDLQGNLITTKSFNQGALTCAGGAIWKYGVNQYLLMGCLDTVINVNDAPEPQYVACLDSGFNFRWLAIYNSPENRGIYIDKGVSDGGVVLVGFKDDSTTGRPVGWIAKVDSNGNKLWEHFYTRFLNRPATFTDFQETFDHGFIICGETPTLTSQDSWIVKLDSNGCLDSNCVINTGTHELLTPSLQLNVFPNPADKNVTVAINGEKGELMLFDLLGKELLQRKIENEKQMVFDVSSLPNGIYLLQFKTQKGLYSTKLLKE